MAVGYEVPPAVFQALTIAAALKLYTKTGMKPNAAYTPTNMMKMAASITGQTFKARDYRTAAAALKDWAYNYGKEPEA